MTAVAAGGGPGRLSGARADDPAAASERRAADTLGLSDLGVA